MLIGHSPTPNIITHLILSEISQNLHGTTGMPQRGREIYIFRYDGIAQGWP
jgi:hypothetical protein